MTEEKEEIINSIDNYIQSNGGNYNDWFLGICGEPQELLPRIPSIEGYLWMYKYTGSPKIAREVLEYFATKLGVNYQTRSTDGFADIIYVYKKVKRSVF